jgi:uncharacterized protein YpbB
MIEKGSFVRIRTTLLQPKERSNNIPVETQSVPYKMWTKGYLLEDADLFDMVTIKTITGRVVTGRLKEHKPTYKHGYGDFVEEELKLRQVIKGDFYE